MAGNAGAVRAGRAEVEIGTDNKPFDIGLSHASRRLAAFGKSVTAVGLQVAAVGLGIGAGLLAAAKHFADSGSELADMSARTGDTAENLGAIGYAAGMTGSELAELEAAYSKMATTIAGAQSGEKASVKLLRDLGLSADALAGKLPTEQFGMFADKLSKISDNSQKIDLVKSIFGKSGTKLLPLLNSGSAGIKELTAEAVRLGLVLSNEEVEAADALGDAMDRMRSSIGAVVNRVGAALAPALTRAADALVNVAGKVATYIKENEGLIIKAGVAAIAITTLGGTLIAFGLAVSVVAAALSGLGIAIAVLTSPITLVVAGIAAATAALLHFTGYGKELVDNLASGFSNLSDQIMRAVGLMGELQVENEATKNAGAGTSIVDKILSIPGVLGAGFDAAKLLGESGALGGTQQGLQQAARQVQPAFAANARGSAGAASSIAGAVNSQQSIPAQMLAEAKKSTALLQSLLKKNAVTVTEIA